MNTHRSTFQIKTVTFNLSLAEGVDITALQGKKYRLTIPMNSLVFDNTGGQSAWFYAVLPVQLGSGSTPVPAGIYVDDVGVHEFLGSDEGDPRKSIVSRLVYEISFASDADTFDNLPLVVKGFAVATNAPASFSLPSFTPTVNPEVEVSDIGGDALPQGIGFENIPGGSISDASTLNGQPASYYLNTTTVLGDLADVDATGAVEGYVLTYGGSGWEAAEPQGGSGGGSVESVTATLPIASTGGTNPVISIAAASGSNAGSMSAAHYNKLEGIEASATANDTDANLKNRANHTGEQAINTVTGLQSALDLKADLEDGKIVSSQLPSYVDDVLEYADFASLPETGESGKIYITQDDNKTWRWSGSTYVEISASLALGETSNTAYRGDRGKTAYDHAQLTSGNPHSVTKADVGLGDVDNTSDLNKPISTAVQAALDEQEEVICISVTDETLPLTTGAGKVTFRMPFAMTLIGVRASLTTASSSGNPTFDINENGTTILSAKLSIDSGEKTSTTAATPAVISDASLADDAEITVDIDTAGTGAAGAKIYLLGTRA